MSKKEIHSTEVERALDEVKKTLQGKEKEKKKHS